MSVLLALVLVAAPALAQDKASRGSPELSLAIGPSAIIQARDYPNYYYPDSPTRSPPDDWYYGASAALRVGVPMADRVVAIGHVIAFGGQGGRRWQSALAGLELRLGGGRQVPITVAGGIVRQPVAQVCVESCPAELPPFDSITHPTLGLAIGYLLRLDTRTEVGPEFTWTRALTRSERFHSVHLGLRFTRRL